MAFELVYVSKAGTRSYWTSSHHFTKSSLEHYAWPDEMALIDDLGSLREKYPTIFRPKNPQRFFVQNNEDLTLKALARPKLNPLRPLK